MLSLRPYALHLICAQIAAVTHFSGMAGAAPIESLIPSARLAHIKAALPEVASPQLQEVLASANTLWYDDEVMTPSYQDSLGASSNDTWPNLVAGSESVISGVYNRSKQQWRFPFGTTAGTDDSTNLQVTNFVYLPHQGGQVETVTISRVYRNANRAQWTWKYQPGTVFGEILFIEDGANLLPAEIRTRTRLDVGPGAELADSWAMNVYRPFPRAIDLAARIKELRQDWHSSSQLRSMVDFLEDNTTLEPASLRSGGGFGGIFQQDGYLDYLPDFADDQLVRTLLTTTPFKSAYGTAWKQNGGQKAFAAATRHAMSIVPINYQGGLLEVTDESCMRCHKETGRLMSEFYFDLYLYGELWGKDGIFTFHPWDESRYPQLRNVSYPDNRSLNPVLRRMDIFRTNF